MGTLNLGGKHGSIVSKALDLGIYLLCRNFTFINSAKDNNDGYA